MGQTFSAQDSLEIVMDFKLPDGAEITDMWLWVGEDIMRAEMMDKWTAQQTYNGIVARRIDPAILKVVAPNEYQINIFPLMVELPRRIKITYLVPNNKIKDNNLKISPIPLNLLQLSNHEREMLHLLYWPEEEGDVPTIVEDINHNIYPLTHPVKGDYFQIDISNIESLSSINVKYGKPTEESLFTGIFNDQYDNENYYQLEIRPEEIFDISLPKKPVFLFDVVEDNITGLELESILSDLKESILYELEDDVFSILCSLEW